MKDQTLIASLILALAIIAGAFIAKSGANPPPPPNDQQAAALAPLIAPPPRAGPSTRPQIDLEFLLAADEPLAMGDIVEVRVHDLSDFGPRFCRIGKDGNIDLWLIGNVPAAGRSSAQLEKDIAEAYKRARIVNEATVMVTPQRIGGPSPDRETVTELSRPQPRKP